MNDVKLIRRARVAFGLIVLLFSTGLLFAILNRNSEPPATWGSSGVLVNQLFYLAMFSFPMVGYFVATRQPRNAIGWILLAIGADWGFASITEGYSMYALITNPGALPGADELVALTAGEWVVPILLMGTFLLILFPDGKLPSRRWRWLPWLAVIAGTIAMTTIALYPGSLGDVGYPELQNPFGAESLKPFLDVMQFAVAAIPLCLLSSAVALVQKYRKSEGIERLQLKWFVAAAATVALVFLVAVLSSFQATFDDQLSEAWSSVVQQIAVFSFALIPIAAGIAILKYRLYDIDVVINKTIVFGVLAAFITLVYVAIVVGIGTLLGSSDEPNLALSIAATAVVAIAFSPVKEKTQRIANRLVYGHRASPYEVMANLAKTVAAVAAPTEVLDAIAHAGATAVNATTRVTLKSERGDTFVATWPKDADTEVYDDSFAVTHRGTTLGTLEVKKPKNEPLGPKDRELLDDLCAHAGLGLHNAGLVLELQARLAEIQAQTEELTASRERIVSAQDDSRKVLEKDITSGPKKGLEAITEKLARAHELITQDPEEAAVLLDEISADTTTTLDALREIARGIYPPLLADKGIAAALEAHIRKHDLDVALDIDPDLYDTRFDPQVETTVYFCCAQVLQPSHHTTRVALATGDGALRVDIEGVGDLDTVILADRVSALDGSLSITGGGLHLALPASVLEPA